MNKKFLPLLFGGGVLKPAASSEILQDLYRTQDGLVVDDKKTLLDDAVYEGVNGRSMDGVSDYITYPGEDVSTQFQVVINWKSPSTLASTKDLYGQSAGGGTGRAWLRIQSNGQVQTFIGGGGAVNLSNTGAIVPDTRYKLVLRYDAIEGELVLFINDVMWNQLTLTPEAADGVFNYFKGHSGTTTIIEGEAYGNSIDKGDQTNLDVIVIAGQSNTGQSGASAPSPLGNKMLHRYGYSFGTTPTRSNDGFLDDVVIGSLWGPEFQMGWRLFHEEERKVLILRVSEGSTGLADDWLPGGDMYDEFKLQFAATESAWEGKGYVLNFSKFIWIHGETDSNLEADANSYLTNYDSMRDGWETDIGFSASIPTIITQTPFKAGVLRTYQSIVEGHQQTIASRPGNSYIGTRDLPIRGDDETHYTSDGLVTLGDRITDIYLASSTDIRDYVYNAPVQEGGSRLVSYDISGNENHGTIVGGTVIQVDGLTSINTRDGFTGVGVFDGSNDGATAGTNFNFEKTDTFTFLINMKYEATPSAFNVYGGNSTASIGWELRNGGSGNREKLLFTLGDGVTSKQWLSDDDVIDTNFADYEVRYDGSEAVFYKDGVALATTKTADGAIGSIVASQVLNFAKRDPSTANAPITVSKIAITGPTSDSWGFGAQTGTTLPSSSGENDATLFNIAEVFFWGGRVPAGSGVFTSPTNQGGFVHNGSEVTLVQTDADETIFGGVNFYTADEITWDKKSYADIQAHPNGSLNLWIKQVSLNGVCHVKELVQYDVTKVFTAAESLQNLRWAGSSGCGAVVAYVLAGYVDIGYVL